MHTCLLLRVRAWRWRCHLTVRMGRLGPWGTASIATERWATPAPCPTEHPLPTGGSDLESSHTRNPLHVPSPAGGAGFGLGMVLTPASCFITLNSTFSQSFSSCCKGFLYSAYHILFSLLNSKGNKSWMKLIKLI